MARSTSLDLLQQRTADLVSQELRSESAAIARLCALIIEAVRTGHSHRSIHSAITAGGLAISPTNYRIALGRARKSRHNGSPTFSGTTVVAATSEAVASRDEPMKIIEAATVTQESSGYSHHASTLPADHPTDVSSGTSSVTRVLDSLRRAQEVASKDYRRIAIDNYRQRLRNPTLKDLT
jgi:hypothetical protein